MGLFVGDTAITKVFKGDTQLSKVFEGDTKTRPVGGNTESIVISIKAWTDGKIRIPKAGYSTNGTMDCPYNWNIQVDDGPIVNYSGTGASQSSIGLSGYTANSVHTVTITPVTENYGWARAFGFNNVNTSYCNLLQEVLYDGSYMGYAVSATDTGNYFRYRQYMYCQTITSVPEEVLPNTVTTIGNYFRAEQYIYGARIQSLPNEVMPNSVTSIGNYFRYSQYRGAIMTSAPAEVMPDSVTSIGTYFRASQYAYCQSLLSGATEKMSSSVTSIPTNFRDKEYEWCIALTTTSNEDITSSITSIGNYFRYRQYRNCSGLVTGSLLANTLSSGNKRRDQFVSAGNTTTPMTITISGDELDVAYSSAGLNATRVNEIRVPSTQLSNYQGSSDWSAVSSKFVAM